MQAARLQGHLGAGEGQRGSGLRFWAETLVRTGIQMEREECAEKLQNALKD